MRPSFRQRRSGTADEMRKARGGIERKKDIQQSTRQGTSNNTRIREEGGGAGGVGGEGGEGDEGGEGKK